MELASSIRNRQNWSPEILSDRLHDALQDLNTALNTQPRLFLGAETGGSLVSVQTVKSDTSAITEWKSKRASQFQPREGSVMKPIRPQLSRIAITSLEFSEALPFTAFASLLVETVARLDLVIEEVEELGRIARFKEFKPGDEIAITCEEPRANISCNHLTGQSRSYVLGLDAVNCLTHQMTLSPEMLLTLPLCSKIPIPRRLHGSSNNADSEMSK